MAISSYDLRHAVIKPTLAKIGLWPLSAENLLMGTAAHESRLGYYLKQVNGPALGIYQIEPATHRDVWANFLKYKDELKTKVNSLATKEPSLDENLIYNLAYATAIARIIYFRVSQKMPEANDLQGLAEYWKEHYNTHLGKGTVAEFIKNYHDFVDLE